MRSLSTIVALASAAQLASATGWTDASAFNCPSNTNNQCNPQQSSGFDWSSLNLGSFTSYGEFSFDSWTCASSFGGGGKRDLEGRNFQDKCITGTASTDKSKCPSFGCGSSPSVSAFSITEVQISVEFDCQLEFHYDMPGGTTCKQTSSCSAGGSTVKNSQCGGAKNVTVVYPSQSSGSGKGKNSCSIGVHSVGFDCSTASSTVIRTTSTKSTAKATTPAQITKTTESKTISTPVIVKSTSSKEIKTTSSAEGVKTTSSVPFVNSNSTSSIGLITSSTPAAALTTSTPSVSEVITTVVIDTTVTTCPVTLTHTTAGTTSLEITATTSTVLITTTKTFCPKCEGKTSSTALAAVSSSSAPAETTTSSVLAAVSTSSLSTATTSSSGPITTAPCPDVLPQCLNTWLFTEGCSSNTDTDCFCPSSSFVTNVFACLSAYGASADIIASAQTYFQGICAVYIPSNPAIVTCASSVATTGQASTYTVPVTTVQVFTTVVVPCTESTGISAGNTIPSSSSTIVISTSVVVPQVVFATTTGISSAAAVLVTGEATSAPAAVATTLATPAKTTLIATSTANGTIKASSTPTQQTTSSAGKNTMALSSLAAALLFAFMIL